jgi:hypothetical protein
VDESTNLSFPDASSNRSNRKADVDTIELVRYTLPGAVQDPVKQILGSAGFFCALC